MSAQDHWEAALARWAWPEAILAAAPSDPWQLTPQELQAHRRTDRDGPTPADVAALDALPRRGSVLDVGCGPGGSSAALRRQASLLTGVDTRPAMLDAFREASSTRPGLVQRLTGGAPEVVTVEGRWPDVADEVTVHDVVVCHNVLYDVGREVGAFITALTDKARHTVVLSLTDRHPLHWLNPYAEMLHGITRPADPDASLAAEVVREVTGHAPTLLTWTEQLDPPQDSGAFERMVARRCCVGEERLDDVGLALHRVPPPGQRRMAALVWSGAGSG